MEQVDIADQCVRSKMTSARIGGRAVRSERLVSSVARIVTDRSQRTPTAPIALSKMFQCTRSAEEGRGDLAFAAAVLSRAEDGAPVMRIEVPSDQV